VGKGVRLVVGGRDEAVGHTVDIKHKLGAIARPGGILPDVRVAVATGDGSSAGGQKLKDSRTRRAWQKSTYAKAEHEPSAHEHCWPFSGHQAKSRHQRPAARWTSSQRAFHTPLMLAVDGR